MTMFIISRKYILRFDPYTLNVMNMYAYIFYKYTFSITIL